MKGNSVKIKPLYTVSICLAFIAATNSASLGDEVDKKFGASFIYLKELTRSAVLPFINMSKQNHDAYYPVWPSAKKTIGIRIINKINENTIDVKTHFARTANEANRLISTDDAADIVILFHNNFHKWDELQNEINNRIKSNSVYKFPSYVISRNIHDCELVVFPSNGNILSVFVGINTDGTTESINKCIVKSSFFAFGINVDDPDLLIKDRNGENYQKYAYLVHNLYTFPDNERHMPAVFWTLLAKECEKYCEHDQTL